MHNVPKEAEGTYYTVPFPVSGDLEQIRVSYSYKRLSGRFGSPADMVNIVDLGLMDEKGLFLGWSGSARDTVFVGPRSSTNGYLMTEIKAGQWQIIVGAYRIPDGGLDVRYEISFTPKTRRWLTGDLHIHSDASDGQHDVASLAKKAGKAGLDFIAVADHNNYSENLHPLVIPGLTLLPAVEWTHYRGHMNFFGAAAPFENSFIANSEDEMLALVAQAKDKGALISVNHPKCPMCPFLWQSDDCFDLIEVWNGPMRKANTDAIKWWDALLRSGRRIPMTGGSDYHRDRRPVRFARPVSRVYALSPDAAGILSALESGHSYVTASPGGVALDLRCGGSMMGDVAVWREGLELSLRAERLRPGMRLKLVASGGFSVEWRRFKGGRFSAEAPVPEDCSFAYLVAVRAFFGREFVRAISNPIYFTRV